MCNVAAAVNVLKASLTIEEQASDKFQVDERCRSDMIPQRIVMVDLAYLESLDCSNRSINIAGTSAKFIA